MQKPYYFLGSVILFFLTSFLLFQFNTGNKTEYNENGFDDITTVVFEGEDPIKISKPKHQKKQKTIQVSKIIPQKKEIKTIKPQVSKKIIVQKIKPQVTKKLVIQKPVKPSQQLITANNIEEVKLRPLKTTGEDIKLRGL